MKKLFKKGLLALTLIAGMTFAAPQTASAKYLRTEVIIWKDGGKSVTSYYDNGHWSYIYGMDGNLCYAIWYPNDNGKPFRFG